MPIILPPGLPAASLLRAEGLPVLSAHEARDLRPLEILLVNLMPDKITTETQLARMLAGTSLPVRLTLAHMGGHVSNHVPSGHLDAYYCTVAAAMARRWDGMLVTGAPIELLEYEQVDYWREMTALVDYARQRVPTIYLCWAAMAALWHRYGIPKHTLPQKLHGVFTHGVGAPLHPLMQGIEEGFWVPHSRQAENHAADICQVGLSILAQSDEAGVHIAADEAGREVYIFGHMEYDSDTLWAEYIRDLAKNSNAPIPRHYFNHDNPAAGVRFRWQKAGALFFSNWLAAVAQLSAAGG